MKKRKLKPLVKMSIVVTTLVISLTTILVLNNSKTKEVIGEYEEFTYVNDYIFDNYYPVVNQEEKLTRPYTSDKVSINKNFYDKDDSVEEQKNSIIYHEGIYMQNSGVDYKSEEVFDVVASISGTVTNISDDNLLGKTVEIRTSNELVTMYQSLGDVLVKKGENITQGQIIGKSGACLLNDKVKNGLHFEIYKSGSVINPEKYYEKSLKDVAENN